MAIAARTRGDHLAVEADDGAATYARLDALVDGAARRLGELGMRRGDRVSTTLPPSLAFVVLMHATARAGIVLVPLNTRLAAGELAAQREDAAAALEVGEPLEPAEGEPLAASLDAGAVRAVLFTSGTSGRPKPVELTNANFRASARASAAHLGSEPCDRWLLVLSLFHVGGLSIPLRAAFDGVTAIVHPAFDTDRVKAAFEAGEVTLVSLVPTMLARLRDAGLAGAPNLRVVLLGGAPADPALAEWAWELGLPIRLTYGMTETAAQVATADVGARGAGIVPGARVEIGPGGEILVRGPMVAEGVLGDDGWHHTGDAGTIGEDGLLYVDGRIKDTIISGGENVSPLEVERALLAHPAVAEAAALGVPDPEWGEAVAALAVLSGEATPDELVEHCRSLLAGYKRPKTVRIVPGLPYNAAGKLVRADLPNLL